MASVEAGSNGAAAGLGATEAIGRTGMPAAAPPPGRAAVGSGPTGTPSAGGVTGAAAPAGGPGELGTGALAITAPGLTLEARAAANSSIDGNGVPCCAAVP